MCIQDIKRRLLESNLQTAMITNNCLVSEYYKYNLAVIYEESDEVEGEMHI